MACISLGKQLPPNPNLPSGPGIAKCECPIPESNVRTEYEVLVHMYDSKNELVTRAAMRVLVGPKRE